MQKRVTNLFLILISIGFFCGQAIIAEGDDTWEQWTNKTAENIVKSVGATTQRALMHVRKNRRIKRVNPQDRIYLDLYAGKRIAIPAGFINKARTVKFTKAEFNATPLMAALLGGYVHVMEYLLKNGANPDAVNKDDLTALHLAARAGLTSAVHKLIDFKADPNRADKEGRTPLMYAVMKNKNNDHLAIIKLLLTYGADVSKEDSRGKTALHYAKAKHDNEVIKLLAPARLECEYNELLDDYICHFGVPR